MRCSTISVEDAACHFKIALRRQHRHTAWPSLFGQKAVPQRDFPRSIKFSGSILHAIDHTRAAGTHGQQNHCRWPCIETAFLLEKLARFGSVPDTACGHELPRNTAHKQRVVRLIRSLHRVGKCDTFSLGPTKPDPLASLL